MLLSEVAKEVNLTKRAIKYYEEQELTLEPEEEISISSMRI